MSLLKISKETKGADPIQLELMNVFQVPGEDPISQDIFLKTLSSDVIFYLPCWLCVADQTQAPVLKNTNFIEYLIADVIRTYIFKSEGRTFTSDLDSDKDYCHVYIVKTKIKKIFCLVTLKSLSNCSFFRFKISKQIIGRIVAICRTICQKI